MYSFAIHTLGCKVNQYETETIVNDFLRRGFELVDFSDAADVYIINTCTVTGTSDHKSRQWIARALRGNPQAIVAVTGCYAQRAKQEIENIPGVDLVIGNYSKDKIAELVSKKLELETYSPRILHQRQHFHTRALVKVEDGCNNFCSFCIVPYVRGEPKSRDLQEVMSEVSYLVKTGVKEIVLTGVNLGKYGKDLKPELALIDLLESLERMPELTRIRLSSIEVKDLTSDIIRLLSSSPSFCRHLHIPLQSGDDNILQRMNRNYQADEYLQVADEVKQKISDVALTTDVMVGFPGETREQFEKTTSMMERVKFRKAHVFKYSDRQGTQAANLPGKVSADAKERRSRALIELSQNLAENFLQVFVGKKVEVLVERVYEDGQATGLTDNYARVFFAGGENIKDSLVRVLVDRRDGQNLHGRII